MQPFEHCNFVLNLFIVEINSYNMWRWKTETI